MIALKLAFRNLLGAGLRTWLNVSVLSFAFVVIVLYNGILDGWNLQAYNDMQDWAVGNGQLWHEAYDPYDPYCLQDAHGSITEQQKTLIQENKITPVLIAQASIFPQGRMQNVLLKGIDPKQKIVKLPTASLSDTSNIKAIIGKRMAASAKLKKGDQIQLRWRDKNGTFDAREIEVADIFSANAQVIDNGQVWISLSDLQKMTGLTNEATLFITSKDYTGGGMNHWKFKDVKYLLKEIDDVVQSKKAGSAIMYGLLLAIALLAIFDTQVFSVFRRQKEIGTYIALGMTRLKVISIFTFEGGANSILAILLGSIYGIPLLGYLGYAGIPMPKSMDSYGLAIADKIMPVYSMGLILSTVLLVVISATIVSYFPSSKISKMKPTDALKGKMQ